MRKRPLIIFNARVPIIKVSVSSAALVALACCCANSFVPFIRASRAHLGRACKLRTPGSAPDPPSGACRALHRRGQP